MKDLLNLVHPVRAISPVSVADNTAVVGAVVDRQGFESLTFMIAMGTIADPDATFVVSMDHGSTPTLTDAAAVPATELIGTTTLAGFQFDDDNETRKLGYCGIKRYVRLTITPVNNAAAALVSAIALLGHPAQVPTANPPA